MQKYYNPRLHNAVVAGTGMEHPRRPHVVLGSELNGYVQGDLVDANGICDLIQEKSTNTLARLDSLESSLKNETKARTQDKDNIVASLNTLIADKLGSTETVQGESAERQAGDAALQLQIDEQNTKYTTVQTAVNDLITNVNNKQDALVGGTNIKNIDDGAGNTISLLGSGNVSFKTINGQSIIGSDDIEISGNANNDQNDISKYINYGEEIINVSEKITTEEMWDEIFSDYDYNNYPGCLAEIVHDLYEYDGVDFDGSVFYLDENINPEGEEVLVRITEIDNQGMDYSVFSISYNSITIINRAGNIDDQYTYDPNLRFEIFIDEPGSTTQNWELVDYLTGKINDYDTLVKSSSFAYSYQAGYKFSSGGDTINTYGLFFYVTNYNSDFGEITLSAFDIGEQGPRAQIMLRSAFFYGKWNNYWDKPKIIDMRDNPNVK